MKFYKQRRISSLLLAAVMVVSLYGVGSYAVTPQTAEAFCCKKLTNAIKSAFSGGNKTNNNRTVNRAARVGDRGTITNGNFNNFNNGKSYATVNSQAAANALGRQIQDFTGGRIRTFALRDVNTGRIVGYTAITTPRTFVNNRSNSNSNSTSGGDGPATNANLTSTGFTIVNTSSFDSQTGIYGSVTIGGTIRNVGSQSARASQYGINITDPDKDFVGNTSILTPSATASANATFSDIPFGDLDVALVADITNVISESNESDNVITSVVTLPPPTPDMTLTTPQEIITNGTAVISWDTDAEYPMDCTVAGAGIASLTFDPSVSGSTGDVTASDLTSTGSYELRCVEPVTGAEFVETLSIEVVGEVQEI